MSKYHAAGFVPYRKEGDTLFFFLQKRTADAPRAPGFIGLFGGGIEEGETSEQAMMREVKEELTYTPVHPVFFDRYENDEAIMFIFIEEVDDSFESTVNVQEGEYGKFFSAEEVATMQGVYEGTRQVIPDLVRKLT